MIWSLIVVVLILWLLGFGPLAWGNTTHLLLLVVLVLLFAEFANGRRGGPDL